MSKKIAFTRIPTFAAITTRLPLSSLPVKEILNKEVIRVGIGKREFEISPSDLMIQPYQTIALKGKGISKINTVDIYDISKKSNILVNISLL